MRSEATDPDAYIEELPAEKKEVVRKLRAVLTENLPQGFTETMGYGMISYVVPHEIYPAGYCADPKQPLPFISLAAQKQHYAVYHMGLYPDSGLMDWLLGEFRKLGLKPDIGKCCIRFKNPQKIPWELMANLATKLTPAQYIKIYESALNQPRPK